MTGKDDDTDIKTPDSPTCDQNHVLLSESTTNQAESSFDSDPEMEFCADSHFRLQEAIKMSVFRSEGDGQPGNAFDDVTRASEKDGLVTQRNSSLSPEAEEQYRIGILVVSWVSMVVLMVLGVATFVLSLKEHNNASFAFALDAIMVCASSVVIIWRYTIPCGNGKNPTYSFRKEKIACLILGIMFYISAIGVIIRCLVSLIRAERSGTSMMMWKMFAANAFCCTVFAVAEIVLALGLKSVSIVMDAINTSLAAVVSLSGCITDLIFLNQDVNIWYIDDIIGIFCGITMIIYSTWAMAHVVFHKDNSKESDTT